MSSIKSLIDQAPVYAPVATSRDSRPPPLDEAAFYGLAGKVIRLISPYTEADQAALLLNFLAYFGNAAGSGPHAVAEGAVHGTRLFVCIVGATSKGRKGSADSQIRSMFSMAEHEWVNSCVKSGLSSGEGLMYHVRDAIYKVDKNGHRKLVKEGVADKRLLVIESEFASSLKLMNREGNILSSTVRQAWDSGNMTQLVKNDPVTVTGAHVSLVGHISKEELLRYLNDVEQANGFANRFVWCFSERSKILPEGGGIPPYEDVVPDLLESLETARTLGLIERDDQARELWANVYEDLSTGRSGLSGAILNRAEAQVLRLSVLYAAIDGAKTVRLPHLKAALAVWEYSEASCAFIFGAQSGDAISDKILSHLRANTGGSSRAGISNLFNRNIRAHRLEAALRQLEQGGLVEMNTVQTGGRSAEVWTAKEP